MNCSFSYGFAGARFVVPSSPFMAPSLSYLEPREIARQSRRKQLKEQFGFDCDCRLCGAGEGKTKPLEDFIQDHGAQEKTRPEYAPVPPAPVNGGDIASRSNPHSVDPDPKPVERPKYERSTGWQSSPDPTSPNVEVESPSMDTFQNAEVDVEEADDLGTKGMSSLWLSSVIDMWCLICGVYSLYCCC